MGPAFRSCPSGSLWGLAAAADAPVPRCVKPEPALGCAGRGLRDAFASLWELPPAALVCPVRCGHWSRAFSFVRGAVGHGVVSGASPFPAVQARCPQAWLGEGGLPAQQHEGLCPAPSCAPSWSSCMDQSGNFPCYGFFYFKRENLFSWVVFLPSVCPTLLPRCPSP